MEEVGALIKKVEDLYNKEQYKEIISLLDNTLLDKYNNATLYAWRAWAYNRKADSEKASGYPDKAVGAEYDNAIADYSKAIELNKNYSYAYHSRGLVWYENKEYDTAIADYNKAIELKKDYTEAYYDRGLTWYGKKEYDNAIIDYSKAIELNKDYTLAYYGRSLAWYYKEKYDNAIADCNKAIELNKDYPHAYNGRGLAWYEKKEYDKAIADYNKAIELKSDYAEAYNNRALTWEAKKENDKAIADFNKTIELKNDYANAFRNRGVVFYNKGDFQKAIDDFEKAISLDESFDFLKYNIKLAHEKLEERKALEESKAQPSDKDEKIEIERKVERLINTIREVAKSKVRTVVHYTKVFVADLYVKNKNTKMHYSNAIYMNDPMEGKIFFEYLDDKTIEEAYENGEKRTETSVYLGSFLPAEEDDGEISHEDELVMWRTYGKNEHGNEAAGCSIVLSCDFFNLKIPNAKEIHANTKSEEELLNVVYVKRLKNKKEITNTFKKDIEPVIKDLRQQLLQLIVLKNKYEKTDDFYKDIENTIFKQLSSISYLFKSADYDFEHEVRVITYMPRNSDTIKYRELTEPNAPPKRFYIESYNNILPYVKKIFLGPKVENPQQWSLYFDYEIRQRAKEMEGALPPIKASDIEIMKSMCKFQ